jgi:hypothetical protein
MVRRPLWLVVASALVLAACVPAGAHAEFRVPLSVEVEPVVFPDGMVAVDLGGPFSRADQPRVTFTSPRGQTRPLRQFDGLLARARRLASGDAFSDEARVKVAASRSWIAVTADRIRTSFDGAAEFQEVLSSETQVAGRRGRARTVARCAGSALVPVVVGTRIAYVSCIGTAVVVRDLARSAAPPERLAIADGMRVDGPLQLAGGHVLMILAPRGPVAPGPDPVAHTLVVLERATGREVSRVAGYEIASAALRADGTVVMAAAPLSSLDGAQPRCHVLFVVAPGDPARSLPGSSCTNQVTVAGDRILASGILTDLAGTAPRRLVDGRYYATFAGADGLVRLESPACEAIAQIDFVAVERLLARGPGQVKACTLRFAGRTARVDRRGFVHVAYRCPAGCAGSIRLYLRGTRREVPLGGEYGRRLHLDAPPARLAVTRGGRLSPAYRALLARRGRLVVDAVATVPQAEGPAGTAPPEKRFRARLTLVG